MFDHLHTTVARATFALIVAAIFAHIWFASAQLPLGGPNVWMAGAAAVAAALWCALMLRQTKFAPGAAASASARLLGAGLPVVAVAVLFLGWMLVVYWRTGTFNSAAVGKLAVGIGLLLAILLSVDGIRRAKALIVALIAATAVSVLFGFAVLGVGEPFLSLWLHISNVAETDLSMVLVFGRSAGATAHPSTLAYQLAAAVPLAFAAFVHGAFGQRRRRAANVALFVVLVAFVSMLLVNGSRSTILGLGVALVVCAAGFWGAPSRRGLIRRCVVTVPLAAIVLATMFAPARTLVAHSTDWVKNGDVEGIRPGAEEVESGSDQLIGHVFDGTEPGKPHLVRIREHYNTRGAWGKSSGTTVTADEHGRVGVSWLLPNRPDVTMWQARVRAVNSSEEWPWRLFSPTLASPSIDLEIRGLTAGHKTSTDGQLICRLTGLPPEREHVVELRAQIANQTGSPVRVSGVTDAAGALTLSWPILHALVVHYRCRVRLATEAAFGKWRGCAPSLPPLPVWEGLEVGADSLAVGSGGNSHRMGHAHGGLRSWRWYALQLRERLLPAVSRAPRRGEVTAKPDRAGVVVVTWPEPASVEGVAGYEFRIREIINDDWFGWREFGVTLTSRVPPMPVVSTGGSATGDPSRVRHTVYDLVPAMKQPIEVRMRNQFGAGLSSKTITVTGMENGSAMLEWPAPAYAGPVPGYQLRLRRGANRQWGPWRDLAEPVDGGRTSASQLAGIRAGTGVLDLARNAERSIRGLSIQERLFTVKHSALGRIAQATVALRYALDHPFGAGVYRPSLARHAPAGMAVATAEDALQLWPHNQFLHVLAVFGAPGLALQVCFYALLARTAWRVFKAARRSRQADSRFLGVAVVAAWGAYSVSSLFVPTGPFLHDWGHFFVLGLLLALERLLVGAAPSQPSQPLPASVERGAS